MKNNCIFFNEKVVLPYILANLFLSVLEKILIFVTTF